MHDSKARRFVVEVGGYRWQVHGAPGGGKYLYRFQVHLVQLLGSLPLDREVDKYLAREIWDKIAAEVKCEVGRVDITIIDASLV